MNELGTSHTDFMLCGIALIQAFRTPHVALSYLIVLGVAILLICGLKYLPRQTTYSRILAIGSGCTVIAIGATLFIADNLNDKAVLGLAMIAFGLCLSLSNWNDAKAKANVAHGS